MHYTHFPLGMINDTKDKVNPYTLESGINVPPWINVAPGKFGKKNKHSPIYTLYLYYLNRLYEVRNKAVAPGKKSKN